MYTRANKDILHWIAAKAGDALTPARMSQYLSPSNLSFQWIGGLAAGDGSIGSYFKKSGGRVTGLMHQFVIVQRTRNMLDAVHHALGNRGVIVKQWFKNKPHTDAHIRHFALRITRLDEMIWVLWRLFGHMGEKQMQVLEWFKWLYEEHKHRAQTAGLSRASPAYKNLRSKFVADRERFVKKLQDLKASNHAQLPMIGLGFARRLGWDPGLGICRNTPCSKPNT